MTVRRMKAMTPVGALGAALFFSLALQGCAPGSRNGGGGLSGIAEPDTSLVLGGPVDTGVCGIESLSDHFTVDAKPLWYGRCLNGRAQGPGGLVYNMGRGHMLLASGVVLNGRFLPGSKLTELNARSSVFSTSGSKVLGKPVGLRDYQKEDLEVLEQYNRQEYGWAAHGKSRCKYAMTGIFDDKRIKNALANVHNHLDGAPDRIGFNWFKPGNKEHQWRWWTNVNDPSDRTQRMIPRGETEWLGACVDGLAEGPGILSVAMDGYSIYHIDIENMSKGAAEGRVTWSNSVRQSDGKYFIYYYKGVWFDNYNDYVTFTKHYNRVMGIQSADKPDQAKKILADRLNVVATDDPTKAAAEDALKEIFNVRFSLTAKEGAPERWSDSLLGLGLNGVHGNTEFYLHWSITPKALNKLPRDIQEINIDLDVGLVVKESMSMGWVAATDQKYKHKTINIKLNKANGFDSKNSMKVFDVSTYLSAGSNSGFQKNVSEVSPRVSIRAMTSR